MQSKKQADTEKQALETARTNTVAGQNKDTVRGLIVTETKE